MTRARFHGLIAVLAVTLVRFHSALEGCWLRARLRRVGWARVRRGPDEGAATDTTWASVQAAGASLSGQRFEYARDVEGSPLRVLRVDVGSQTPRFTSPTRRRGFQMESFTLNGSAAQTVTHDTAGRMTQEFGRTYVWDDFHSLVRAGTASGSTAQAFQYDAFGRLVAVRRGTTNWPIEEELAYDGTQMVAAWNFEETQLWNAQWGQGVDNLVSVRMGTTGTEAFALKDGRGNVTGYYRGQGSTVGLWVTAEYTPEGRVTQRDWVASSTCTETALTKCPRMGGLPFGFHSAYKSPAHGLLYFRNRWYSAEAGQWLSQDPLGEVDSANLYAFNAFDSVNFVDPFGLNKGGGAAKKGDGGTKARSHSFGPSHITGTGTGGSGSESGEGGSSGPSATSGGNEPELVKPGVSSNPKLSSAPSPTGSGPGSGPLCGTECKGELREDPLGRKPIPVTPEAPAAAAAGPSANRTPVLTSVIEFISLKDQIFARVLGSASGANIGPDVGSQMRKLMDEGVSLQESIKTSLNITLNPWWPVLEEGAATSDAVERRDWFRVVLHGGATVLATASVVMMASGAAKAPKPSAYSVVFETKIPKTGAGTREAHKAAANRDLASAMEDSEFGSLLSSLGVVPVGGSGTPGGFRWHHAINRPGTMQLVPQAQHTSGSVFQPVLHPGPSGSGGFAQWGWKW